ncbi:hypothetical protein AQUSIP_19190 [Aquicella siphonis]|uniref:Uncharacterized protein n=1 Tax=Aquicella siphonis TaxID=254247 RepID=A0A5E4PJI9_9COXI|nr:hypothetical protein [Aquicella siphonis]VVC76597.1 hypothetical protein AQUSIP_19190 [Aquicella siphonis]
MKLKTIIGGVFALMLGMGGTAFAAGDYYPPERLHCKADAMGKVVCTDFNRQYLVESTHTANLPTGKDLVFVFASGTAFSTDQNEWSVFYTYKDPDSRNVRLKTVNTSIKPSFTAGSWTKFKDFYTCTTGYMSCPLTNLPARS